MLEGCTSKFCFHSNIRTDKNLPMSKSTYLGGKSTPKGFTNIWKKRGLQLVHFVFYKWYLRFTSTLRFDQLNLDNDFFLSQKWLFQSMYCAYRNGKGLPRRSQCVTGVKGWKSFTWLGAQVGPFWTNNLDPSLFVDYNNECTFRSYLTDGVFRS